MARRRFRAWLVGKLLPDRDATANAFWGRVYNWESWATNEVDYWWDKSDAERLMAISGLWDCDPVAAFQGYSQLADEGCVHAMIWQGHCHHQGHGTEANFDAAYACFTRAMDQGSWIATRDIATLLFENGHFAECEEQLNEGIRYEFIPAYFWLAFYRLERSQTQITCREVKPLLEHAADQGHPGARKELAWLKIKGTFGLRNVAQGMSLMLETARDFIEYQKVSDQ